MSKHQIQNVIRLACLVVLLFFVVGAISYTQSADFVSKAQSFFSSLGSTH